MKDFEDFLFFCVLIATVYFAGYWQGRGAEQKKWIREIDEDCEKSEQSLQLLHPLCSDCPSIGYPTDSTRCNTCPRRQTIGIAD